MDEVIARKMKTAIAKAYTDEQIALQNTLVSLIRLVFNLSESDDVSLLQATDGRYYFPLDEVHVLTLYRDRFLTMARLKADNSIALLQWDVDLQAIASYVEKYECKGRFRRWMYRRGW